MNKIILPYISITKTNELLKKISPKILEKDNITTLELSKILEISRSMGSNFIKTLKAYGFISGKKGFQFTEIGKNYTNFLLRDKEKDAIQLLSDLLKKIDYANDIILKLNQKGQLMISEIGNQLAIFYNKTWENPQTIRIYGAAIASAIGYAGLGFYRDGTLYQKKINGLLESLPSPYVSAEKILKILNALYPIGKDIDAASELLSTTKARLGYEITTCIELDLVVRPYKGFYKLTKIGESFVSPYKNQEERKGIFRKSLLHSRYGSIISKLRDFDYINLTKVGEILKFEYGRFGSEWTSEITVKDYAKRFLSWLKYSDIVEKIDKDNYKFLELNDNDFSIKDSNNTNIETKFSHSDYLKCYLLGKYIGLLSDLTLDIEAIKSIVENIISICREVDILSELLDEWQNDYKLFLDINDSRIFQRDIRQIEKILGVKGT